MGLLRLVGAKCFVKLRDFLISKMPKQVQRKSSLFARTDLKDSAVNSV